jgi:predicted O-methyltransferase YrrM
VVLTKTDEVLREIEAMAEREFLPIVGPRKGKILADAVKEAKPKHVLEVGTLIGYSAILVGRELGADARITTIEIHAEEAKAAERNIRHADILPKVRVIVRNAIKVIPTLKDCFDAVFIDAEKSEYYEYLRLVEEKIHKGTVFVADNAGIFADQMRDYLDYVRNSGKYTSRFVQVGDGGVEISIKL